MYVLVLNLSVRNSINNISAQSKDTFGISVEDHHLRARRRALIEDYARTPVLEKSEGAIFGRPGAFCICCLFFLVRAGPGSYSLRPFILTFGALENFPII